MSILSYPASGAKPQSGLALISSLVTGKNKPGRMWQKPAYRLKFMIRSLMFPKATLKVMNELASNPMRNEILHAQPTLPCKVHRTYLAVNMLREQHASGLCDHYRFIRERMPQAMQLGHLEREHFKLASFLGKDEATYSISMNSSLHLDKEGEITLRFLDENDEPLANVTFALINFQGLSTLFIGAIQGPSQNIDHTRIQQATKACHGLFPKRVLMEAVLLFAEKMNMQQVFAVGNQTHIYANPRYSKRKKSIFADYDSFWETLGAHQHPNGYFHFPAQVKHRSLDDIASKKRAEYRRRYQLLDEMETQIRNRFN
ncbi:VirK/YbjX family protein [Serratia sp. M24T3]|uniref:VirK/YbjX family protein n=1 Tax=Serratia sp. M24T3 TaxID=932213 RepID=UPI0002E7F1AC|nr:VirK/YbjX family protein [Serratia sp. M24T3]